MPESLIKSLSYQTLDALAYIHKSGFFHRDLKPENILVSDKNVVKLADFGLVKESRSAPPFTDYVSTRWYRAPELLLKAEVYNSKVDVFALACIMVELYLLAPLFAGENELDQLSKIISILGTPPQEWVFAHKQAKSMGIKFKDCEKVSFKNIIPNASSHGIDLIEKMLAYDPVKRISAADALKHPYFSESIKTSSHTLPQASISYEFDMKNNQSELFDKKPKIANPRDAGKTDLGNFLNDDSFGVAPNELSQPSINPSMKNTNRVLDDLDLDEFESPPVAPKANAKENAKTVFPTRGTPSLGPSTNKPIQSMYKGSNDLDFDGDLDFFFSGSSPNKNPVKKEKGKSTLPFNFESSTKKIESPSYSKGAKDRDFSLKENFAKKQKDSFENIMENKFKASKEPSKGYVAATLKGNKGSMIESKKKMDLSDDWDNDMPVYTAAKGFLY